jgi:hypothetical protein
MDKIKLESLQDLLNNQINFQKLLGSDIPEKQVKFDDVQMSLSHNVYQTIEFQEYMEADANERKEELIDYLLFLVNKYLFLGVKVSDEYSLEQALWDTTNTCISITSCPNYANVEQDEYITLIRKHCVFKPWKAKSDGNCVVPEEVWLTFSKALEHFRKIASVTYVSYDELLRCLANKMEVNILRQESGY